MLRAVPSISRHAASRLASVQIRHFLFRDCRDLFRVTLPTFSLFGTPEPLAIPAACFKQRPRRAGIS